MASRRNQPESAAQTLDAIESFGDRVTRWVGENPVPVLGGAVALLLAAAVFGLTRDFSRSGDVESSLALARAQGDYRLAMGGNPGTIEIPEPANPETAKQIRLDAIAKYETVAREHAGTPAAGIALLEAGRLQQALGDFEAALGTYRRGIEQLGPADAIRALLLVRVGSVHEAAGRWAEAGEAYESAAAIDGYPLRFDALAEAARADAAAGANERAIAAYDRIAAEAPDVRVAPYITARIDELRENAAGR